MKYLKYIKYSKPAVVEVVVNQYLTETEWVTRKKVEQVKSLILSRADSKLCAPALTICENYLRAFPYGEVGINKKIKDSSHVLIPDVPLNLSLDNRFFSTGSNYPDKYNFLLMYWNKITAIDSDFYPFYGGWESESFFQEKKIRRGGGSSYDFHLQTKDLINCGILNISRIRTNDMVDSFITAEDGSKASDAGLTITTKEVWKNAPGWFIRKQHRKWVQKRLKLLRKKNSSNFSVCYEGKAIKERNRNPKVISAELELNSCLPFPTADVPLCEVLEFKELRKDEFNNFRSCLDTFHELAQNNQIEQLQSYVYKEIIECLKDLNSVTAEKWKKRFLGKTQLSVQLNMNNIISGAAIGAGIGERFSLPIVGGIAGAVTFCINGAAEPIKDKPSKYFQYISSMKEAKLIC